MFGSKQAADAKQAYSVFVLTQDYVVQGRSSDPDSDVFHNLKNLEWKEVFYLKLDLKDGQALSAGRLDLPVQSFSSWSVPAPASVVAVLPGDDAAVSAAQQAFQKKFSFPATIHAGPYVISGEILDSDKDHANLVSPVSIFFPVMNARVSCASLGSKIEPMQVPLLVVNLYLVQGIRWA